MIVGSSGFLGLAGHDWPPQAVGLARTKQPKFERPAIDVEDCIWQQGAALAAECLVTGKELLITPEQTLHVLEIITAARASQDTGRRIALRSTCKWPKVS